MRCFFSLANRIPKKMMWHLSSSQLFYYFLLNNSLVLSVPSTENGCYWKWRCECICNAFCTFSELSARMLLPACLRGKKMIPIQLLDFRTSILTFHFPSILCTAKLHRVCLAFVIHISARDTSLQPYVSRLENYSRIDTYCEVFSQILHSLYLLGFESRHWLNDLFRNEFENVR